jgi:hypothetical protein
MSFILYLPRDQATPAPALWFPSDLKAILYWGFSLQAFQATRQHKLTRRNFPRLGGFGHTSWDICPWGQADRVGGLTAASIGS